MSSLELVDMSSVRLQLRQQTDEITRLRAEAENQVQWVRDLADNLIAEEAKTTTLRAQNAELALSLDVARGDFHRNAAKLWEPLLKAKEDEIERLRAENERLGRALNVAKYGDPDFAWSVHEAQMVALRARVAELEEALRPFAWYADNIVPQIDKVCGEGFYAQLENARAALAKTGDGQ